MRLNLKLTSILFFLLAALVLGGCGDDSAASTDSLSCGEGTEDNGAGSCISTNTNTDTNNPTTTCGSGTSLQGTECVADASKDPLTCGAGTEDDGTGACVPVADPLVCGAGTLPNDQGECIPEEVITCGNGTVDDGSGVCVRVCPEGTVDDGADGCSVDIESLCAGGTVPSDDGLNCLSPEELVRQSVETGDNLVSSSEIADIQSQDDPFLVQYLLEEVTDFFGDVYPNGVSAINLYHGGTANELVLPEIGNTLVLEGNIDLFEADGDITGDSIPDQDWDVWMFEGVAGQVIEVSAVGQGLTSPHFELLSATDVSSSVDLENIATLDDFFAVVDYVRYSPSARNDYPTRQYLLPRDGAYFLRITDSRSSGPNVESAGAFGEITLLTGAGTVTGGPDAGYFMTLSSLVNFDADTVPPVDLTDGLLHDFSGDTEGYGDVVSETIKILPSAGLEGFARFTVNNYDSAVEGLLTFFASDFSESFGPFLFEAGVSFLVPISADGLIASHDYQGLSGYPHDSYDISIAEEPVLIEGAANVFTMLDGDQGEHPLYAIAGDIVEISLDSYGDGVSPILAWFSMNPDFSQDLIGCVGFEGEVNEDVCQVVAPGEPLSMARFYDGAPGETFPFSVLVLDVASAEGTDFSYQLTPRFLTPQSIGVDDANPTSQLVIGSLSPTTPSRWTVLGYNLTDSGLLELHATPETEADITLESFTQGDGLLEPTDSATSTGTSGVSLNFVDQPGTKHLIRISLEDGVSSPSTTLDATFLGSPVNYPSAADLALSIPDDGFADDLIVTDTITIDSTSEGVNCFMESFSVDVNITHTWATDTQITLIDPEGTRVIIEDGADLESGGDFGQQSYPGTQVPVESLDVLFGASPDGIWTLEVGDDAGGDDGILNNWALSIYLTCD